MDVHSLIPVRRNPKVEDFRPGDTVKVSFTIREGERVRAQVLQGVVIRKTGGKGPAAAFTVRRISHNNIGVERIYPLFSPFLESVEVIRHGKVRRARLYYLRGRFGRAARIKERVVRPGALKAAQMEALEREAAQEEAPAVVQEETTATNEVEAETPATTDETPATTDETPRQGS